MRLLNVCHRIKLSISKVVVISVLSFLGGYLLLHTSPARGRLESSRYVECSLSGNSCNFTLKYSALVGNERPEVHNGRPFIFNDSYLRGLGFPILFNETMKKLTATSNDIVFVTASDVWYFEIDMDAIAKVQQHFPRRKIIFYDLASDKRSRLHVQKIGELCNVEYRVFDFSRYPPHVQNLKNYAWKPLVIHDVLLSHDVIFWLDSSVRFHSDDLQVALSRTDVTGGGPIMFDFSGHSIFSATHVGMFDYLPIERSAAVEYGMYGANAILLYRNREIYNAVIRWWFLCAMTPNCMAPTTDLYCQFSKNDSRGTYANCHRYDQSAINILTVNHLTHRYRPPSDDNSVSSIHSPSMVSAVQGQRSGDEQTMTSQPPLSDSYYSPGPLTVERGSTRNEQISVCNAANEMKLIPVRTQFEIK